MVDLERSEDFNSKFKALGSTSQDHFLLCFNRMWLKFLDANATGEDDYQKAEGTIMGSDKKYKAMYSRSDGLICLDIIDY